MEDFIIETIKSLPRMLLVLLSVGFVVLFFWLVYFVATRTSAILKAMTKMLGQLEIAIELLKARADFADKRIDKLQADFDRSQTKKR